MAKNFFQLFTNSSTKLLVLFAAFSFSNLNLQAQVFNYFDSWGESGFTLESASQTGVDINFSIEQFELSDININGTTMTKILLPKVFLPNNEGMPDLPGDGRYIAVPHGADVSYQIVSSRTDVYSNIDVAPALRIPKDTDDGPLQYNKNKNVYERNAVYPESPVIL
jgi:hypothetical protein